MSQSGAKLAVMPAKEAPMAEETARCMTLYAPNAADPAKFHSSLVMTALFTAAIVSVKETADKFILANQYAPSGAYFFYVHAVRSLVAERQTGGDREWRFNWCCGFNIP